MKIRLFTAIIAALWLIPTTLVWAQSKNGFDLHGASIPIDEIHHGGPPKDGIPAIDAPSFIPAQQADFLNANDRVLGVVRNGLVKAYPIAILNWHEIVNDRFKNEAIVISFCPLCGTGVAFSAASDGVARSYGVSGLLYNSDVLLYDRDTDSLWSQLLLEAVAGPLKGTKMTLIPLSHTTWRDWRARHPDTLVLSTQTGFRRNYQRDPYAGYADSQGIFFPVSHRDRRYHPKERVIGLEVAGQFKAYPFAELSQLSRPVMDTFAGRVWKISYDNPNQTGIIYDVQGREVPTIISFWFAWYAFHPDTEVYQANKQQGR